MNAAIDALKAQIKNKRAQLSKLNERMEEFKKLQLEIAAIPRVRADLYALERSLAILKGDEVKEESPQMAFSEVQTRSRRTSNERSVPHLVYSVLKEAGKALTIQQIMPLLAAKGCTAGEPTVRGAIYRNAKIGKMFGLVAPGTFGLLEWKEQTK